MRGGGNLDWIAPLTPEGTREPGVRGCYRGNFSHWNIRGLREGLTARLVSKKRLTERRYQGYRVATAADAQLAGDVPMGLETGMGGALLETENLILCVAPTEKVAERIAQMREQTRAAVDGNISRFQEGAGGSESVYAKDDRRPLRFDDGTRGVLESQ